MALDWGPTVISAREQEIEAGQAFADELTQQISTTAASEKPDWTAREIACERKTRWNEIQSERYSI